MRSSFSLKFEIFLDYLIALCIGVLITGVYLYGIHGALQNVTFAVIGVAAIWRKILLKESKFFLSRNLILSFLAIYLFYGWVLWLDFTDARTFSHGLSNRVLILLFPLMFAVVATQRKRFYHFYFWVYIVSSMVHAALTLRNYYIDITVNKFYTWSGGIFAELIPLSILHHHTGILAVFCIALLFYMAAYYFKTRQNGWLAVSIVCILFLSIFLHILAARISLVAFYALIFAVFIYSGLNNRKLFLGTALVVGIIVLFFSYFGIKNFSTIQIKLDQTFEDFHSMRNEGLSNRYNISGRLNAIKLSIPMIKANLWKGIGINKYESTFADFYQKNFPEYPMEHRLMPANQWVRYIICIGLPLTVLFGVLMLFPYLIDGNLKKYLILYFFFINGIYFMSEFPLDNNNYFYFYSFTFPFLVHFYNAERENFTETHLSK